MAHPPSEPARAPIIPPDLTTTERPPRALAVLVQWGDGNPLHTEHVLHGSAFFVGDGTRATRARPVNFSIPMPAGVTRVPLAIASAEGPRLCVPDGARARFRRAGHDAQLEALDASVTNAFTPGERGFRTYALSDGVEACVEYQGLRFVVWTADHVRLPPERRTPRDLLREHAWTLASIGAHLGVLLLFAMLPPRSAAISIQDGGFEPRFTQFLITPPSVESSRRTGASEPTPAKVPDDAAAPALERPAGSRDRDRPRAPRPALTHDALRTLAGAAGIIGILHGRPPSLRDVFGTQTLGEGDIIDAIGALAYGPLALGTHPGLTRGGGTRTRGTIDVGDLGTRRGSGPDPAMLGLRGRRTISPRIEHSAAKIAGSLRKETIRRVIAAHIREVRYCYEQGLIGRPDLQGRVSMQFVIGETGAVRIAHGIGSDPSLAAVARCIESAVGRWQFPVPEGGGLVSVTYPFMLQLTAD